MLPVPRAAMSRSFNAARIILTDGGNAALHYTEIARAAEERGYRSGRSAHAPPHSFESTMHRLPDLFVFSDVYEAIGYAPDRGSLHRVLQELKAEGHVALHSRGTGTQPTRYRKLVVATEGSGS